MVTCKCETPNGIVIEVAGVHKRFVDYADYTALEQRFDALSSKFAVLVEEKTALERELQMIDELMARRPALDDCKTRYDKISKAITTAAQKDALERERDELKVHNNVQLKVLAERVSEIDNLEAENATLRKRLEPIEEWWDRNCSEYIRKKHQKWDASMYEAIEKAMELKEGE